MYTITFISTRGLQTISTPNVKTAWMTRGALRAAGFRVRMWHKGKMI